MYGWWWGEGGGARGGEKKEKSSECCAFRPDDQDGRPCLLGRGGGEGGKRERERTKLMGEHLELSNKETPCPPAPFQAISAPVEKRKVIGVLHLGLVTKMAAHPPTPPLFFFFFFCEGCGGWGTLRGRGDANTRDFSLAASPYVMERPSFLFLQQMECLL